MADYPKYHGNYLGIVVQNNDPARRGRIKVFVPHITPTVYKNWNELSKDKQFRFVGANIESNLTEILEDLKRILPWSECAAPLAGESSSGRYSKYLNVGTISDSSKLRSVVNSLSSSEINFKNVIEKYKYTQNFDLIGEKPGAIYDKDAFRLNDAFVDPKETNANNVNTFAFNYIPETYSNAAKGSFSIPNVGAHVWVFFNAGEPLKPVYFAASYGNEDWRTIYQASTGNDSSFGNNTDTTKLDRGLDYPGTYENIQKEKYDIDVETYRNKYVINQKGGTIQIVNTDNRESLKFTHYSGSFKEFTNLVNIELATNNDQKLVLNDQFLTVKGDKNEFVGQNLDSLVRGDHYVKVGNLKNEYHKQWKEIVREIADVKQLFDTRRADKLTDSILQLTSPSQFKSGKPTPCPVCQGDKSKYWAYNNSVDNDWRNEVFGTIADTAGNFIFSSTLLNGVLGLAVTHTGVLGKPEFGSAAVLSSKFSAGGANGQTGPGWIMGVRCPACNPDPDDARFTLGEDRPVVGENPSSEGGEFNPETRKKFIKDLTLRKMKELADLESKMGIGGSQIIEITKHKFENIGMTMNDYGSVRVDAKGKMEISDVQIGKFGVFYNRTPSPLVEYVHVDDLPGGNYTLNVCNRYNLQVGAGGINFKSYGPVNMTGTIMNIAGTQVNIASENEVNIDGGKRLSLVADILSLRQRNGKQVVVEGSLGVTGNTIIAGGLHVEGELFCNHITIPREQHATEETTLQGQPTVLEPKSNTKGKILGFAVPLSNWPVPIVSEFGTVQYKVGVPGVSGPPYIGFTDAQVPCGRLRYNEYIGFARGGTQIGYIPIGACIVTGANGGGNVTCTNPNPIAIFASTTLPPTIGPFMATDVPIYASSSGSTIAGFDTPVWGSGNGSFLGPLGPIGGTGTPGMGCIKGSDAGLPEGLRAETMPIVVYGTGRDENSITIKAHSHQMIGMAITPVDKNHDLRDLAMTMNDGTPIPPEPVINAKKTNNSLV